MKTPSWARSADISSPMFAPAPRPKRLPFRITPVRGVCACRVRRSPISAPRFSTAAAERVFIPPESNVTQAMPSRISWLNIAPPTVQEKSRGYKTAALNSKRGTADPYNGLSGLNGCQPRIWRIERIQTDYGRIGAVDGKPRALLHASSTQLCGIRSIRVIRGCYPFGPLSKGYPHLHAPPDSVHFEPQMLHVRLVLQVVKPWQRPNALQVSPVVQVLWSLQGVPAGSKWQVELQQSPLTVLPSSHCSPGSTLPLPHRPGVAVAVRVGVGGTGVAVAVWVNVGGTGVAVAVCVGVGGTGVTLGVGVTVAVRVGGTGVVVGVGVGGHPSSVCPLQLSSIPLHSSTAPGCTAGFVSLQSRGGA